MAKTNPHKQGTKAHRRWEAVKRADAVRRQQAKEFELFRSDTMLRAASTVSKFPSNGADWGVIRVRAWIFWADKARRVLRREELLSARGRRISNPAVQGLAALIDRIDQIGTTDLQVLWEMTNDTSER
jgi:hypothetical protein